MVKTVLYRQKRKDRFVVTLPYTCNYDHICRHNHKICTTYLFTDHTNSFCPFTFPSPIPRLSIFPRVSTLFPPHIFISIPVQSPSTQIFLFLSSQFHHFSFSTSVLTVSRWRIDTLNLSSYFFFNRNTNTIEFSNVLSHKSSVILLYFP